MAGQPFCPYEVAKKPNLRPTCSMLRDLSSKGQAVESWQQWDCLSVQFRPDQFACATCDAAPVSFPCQIQDGEELLCAGCNISPGTWNDPKGSELGCLSAANWAWPRISEHRPASMAEPLNLFQRRSGLSFRMQPHVGTLVSARVSQQSPGARHGRASEKCLTILRDKDRSSFYCFCPMI
jgi:hypothetical protein